MEEKVQAVTVRSVGIKYGFISTLVSVIFFIVLVIAGQNAFDNTWNWIGMIFSIIIMVLAHKNFKDSNTYMSYGQGVGIAFWMCLVSIILGGLFTYVYSNIIDPTVMETFYEKQMEQMSEQNMPDEQMQMAVEWTKKLFWPMYVLFGMFFGVLLGVIVSIFTQKKAPEQSFNG